MTVYVARLIEDRQFVGIFSVEDDSELFWLIDECCDPGAVEISELGSGGVFWPRTIDMQVPIPEDENGETDFDGLPSESAFSGQWADIFFGDESNLRWRLVPQTDDLDE